MQLLLQSERVAARDRSANRPIKSADVAEMKTSTSCLPLQPATFLMGSSWPSRLHVAGGRRQAADGSSQGLGLKAQSSLVQSVRRPLNIFQMTLICRDAAAVNCLLTVLVLHLFGALSSSSSSSNSCHTGERPDLIDSNRQFAALSFLYTPQK